MIEIAFIGFGEAGAAFARPGIRAYDRKTDDPVTAAEMESRYRSAGVTGCRHPAETLSDAAATLSLVTADQALAAATDYAPLIAPGAIWIDMNSVAPDTKRAASRAIEAAGGRYVDVAVMSPVLPKRHDVPLLVSGPDGAEAIEMLRSIGFSDVRAVGAIVGSASAIKMIRSVMVKGIEALTAECLIAAEAAGVTAEVIGSLDASMIERKWSVGANYNLDRMLVHGSRRAAEMEAAEQTLEALGIDPRMTCGTVAWQRALGSRGGFVVPEGLMGKLALLRDIWEKAA